MPSDEEVEQQRKLLSTYRRNMSHYLLQYAIKGQDNVPPHVMHGLREASDNIRRVKIILRDWGLSVENLPDDEWPAIAVLHSDEQSDPYSLHKRGGYFVRQNAAKSLLIDDISKLLSILLDLILLKNPQKSSLGILLGVLLQTLAQIFSPWLKQVQWISFSDIQWHQYWVIGLGLLYLPVLIRHLFAHNHNGLGEDVELALKVIKRAEKSGVSKDITSELYMQLNQMVLKSTVLNERTRREISATDKRQETSKIV